jgi:hypothetical protein
MAYEASARNLARILNEDEKTYKSFVREFNRIGHKYFNSHRSGYAKASVKEPRLPIKVLTRKDFGKELLKYGRNEEDIFENEAAFDDVYRHAVLVDTRALPKMVTIPIESFGNNTSDYVFKWSQVDAFVKAHPDGRYVIVHGDVLGPQFFLPIPTPLNLFDPATLKEMGFNTRKRKQSKQRQTRKNTRTF